MGYTTEFLGRISVGPPLNHEEITYLQKFNETRRVHRTEGPYFIDGTGFAGQDQDANVIDYNHPPEGQPGLWCHWVPTDDGTAIEWDNNEKFYQAESWMRYIIQHFLQPDNLSQLPFFHGHILNGIIGAQGEEPDDIWVLHVINNVVTIQE